MKARASDGDMEAKNQPETLPDPRGTPPITVRDVLRAIFFPAEEEEETLVLPSLPAMPRLWSHGAGMHTPNTADLLSPAAVSYAEELIQSAPAASPMRMAALGPGTVATLLTAYMAQTALIAQGRAGAGAALFALAGLAWLALLIFDFNPSDGGALLRRGPRVVGSTGYPLPKQAGLELLSARGVALMIALLFSAATYVLTAGNTFTSEGAAAWVLSVLAWLLVAAERSPAELIDAWRAWFRDVPSRVWPTLTGFIRPRLLPLVALALVLGTAVFFRFYRLEAIPVEMTSDHVEKLLDTYDVSQGVHHVFFTRNGGREAIQFYLTALAAKLFGAGMSFLTLKLVSALEGLALIPLMIRLGRELVDRETGLLAGALVAVSWWHVTLSRLALRIVLTPLVFTLILITLIRGIRTGSRRAWLWAGVWMGIGVYAYQAMRITPLVAAAAWVIAVAGPLTRAAAAHLQEHSDAAIRRAAAANTLSRQTLNLALAGLVAFAIFVPMLRVWHDYPQELWNRVINRTTESERTIEDEPLDIFLNNYADALRMFNVHGDMAWISAVPGRPMLDRIAGGLFVLGILAWGVRLARRRDPADAFILAAGLIMLLPSALAIAFPIENPSATRASGSLPVVFMLAAWPLALIRQRWTAALGGRLGITFSGVLVGLLLAGSALYSFDTYFVAYDRSYREAALNPSEVADAIREVEGVSPSLDGVWLVGWPYWHDYRAIGIEAGNINFRNALVDTDVLQQYLTDIPRMFDTRPLVFIVHPEDKATQALLREHFPEGSTQHYRGFRPGLDFILYVVPAR